MHTLESEQREHQVFDDRAKASIEYLLKTILNISLASIGACFFLVIKNVEPALSSVQKLLVLISIEMNAAVVFGMLVYVMWSHKKNQLKARALRNSESASYKEFEQRISSLHRLRNISIPLIILCFVFGLMSSVAFMVTRL